MKKRNHKIAFYLIGIIILFGIVFIASKEFEPETTFVEENITIKK